MIEQITTLVEFIDLLSLDDRVILHEEPELLQRLRVLRDEGTAGNNDKLLEAMVSLEPVELFRVFAAVSLYPQTLTADQVTQLHRLLLNDNSISLKTAVVRQLRLVTEPTTINKLFDALVQCSDPQLRTVLAYALAENKITDWKGKIDQMLIVFQQRKYHREHVDCAALVTAIRPLVDDLVENRFLLTDYLIQKAVALADDIERIMGILAGLIIESVGHNLNRANQRLVEYENNHDESASTLILLRSEMNSLLTPAERQVRLEVMYEKPLLETNKKIRSVWEESIAGMQKNVYWGRLVNIAGFAIGVLIVGLSTILLAMNSSYWFWSAFLGVVLLIIILIFSRRVGNDKQILIDIGIANAVYAAYVQRTLGISNTYSDLYLNDKLASKELKTFDTLISTAMNDAVRALRAENETSFEDFINQLK